MEASCPSFMKAFDQTCVQGSAQLQVVVTATRDIIGAGIEACGSAGW